MDSIDLCHTTKEQQEKAKRMLHYLDNIDRTFDDFLFYGVADGVVFVTLNGKREILNIEIAPSEQYPENEERLQALILEAIANAIEEVNHADAERILFLPEDLCLGC